MRYAVRWGVPLAPLLLIGCSLFHRPGPASVSQPRYVVGPAYRAGGVWFYPREDFYFDATGLAVVLPDRSGPTADGEVRDSTTMAGAHATLQLPTIARVTNLETGLQVLVRINDRGPASPGRLIGLTRHAADKLGIAPGGVAQVRVQVENGPSQALRNSLQGGTGIAVMSAPRVPVASETLAPPPGQAQSARGRTVTAILPATAASIVAPIVPARLSDTVVRVAVSPTQLWLRAGEFGQASYANQVRARLGGLSTTVECVRQGRFETFRVRAGPFANIGQADSALDQAMRAGVTDARIVVE